MTMAVEVTVDGRTVEVTVGGGSITTGGEAQDYVDTGRLESEEIAYKVELGRKLAEAREAVLDGAEDWGRLMNTGMTNSYNNPISNA